MAELWISHKRMNADNTRVIKVLAMKANDKLSGAMDTDRQYVVQSIEQGNKWYTCKSTGDKRWTREAEIHVLEVDGEKFIRTDGNKEKSDNLGELPDF